MNFAEKANTPSRVNPELQVWLNMHPLKDDKTCPVWSIANNNKKGLSYMAPYQIVATLAKRAGLPDDISPHSLRPASATSRQAQ
jgi:site-specific recombinase XerD